jgi:hypothetical protein
MKNILKKFLFLTCILSLACPAIPVQASVNKQIILNTTELELNVGGSEQIIASVKPSKKDVIFSWKSSNEDVIKIIENGIVFGVKTGEATVTVTAKGYKKAICNVKVVTKIASSPTMDTESKKKAIPENNNETQATNDDKGTTKKIELDCSELELRFAFAQKLTAVTNKMTMMSN